MLLMDASGGLCMAIVWFQMQTSTLHAGLVEQVGRICPSSWDAGILAASAIGQYLNVVVV